MFGRKIISIIITGLFVFSSVQAGYADNGITNKELLKRMAALEKLVEKQATRIKELEECYGVCEIKIEEHDKTISKFANVDRDISGRLKNEPNRGPPIAGRKRITPSVRSAPCPSTDAVPRAQALNRRPADSFLEWRSARG